jgi:hypothetical protein
MRASQSQARPGSRCVPVRMVAPHLERWALFSFLASFCCIQHGAARDAAKRTVEGRRSTHPDRWTAHSLNRSRDARRTRLRRPPLLQAHSPEFTITAPPRDAGGPDRAHEMGSVRFVKQASGSVVACGFGRCGSPGQMGTRQHPGTAIIVLKIPLSTTHGPPCRRTRRGVRVLVLVRATSGRRPGEWPGQQAAGAVASPEGCHVR